MDQGLQFKEHNKINLKIKALNLCAYISLLKHEHMDYNPKAIIKSI